MTGRRILIIKLTGKAFNNAEIIKSHIDTYKGIIGQGYKIAIIAGGGEIARRYIDIARRAGLQSNYWLDMLGIMASRLNAYLLQSLLRPMSYPRVPAGLEEVVEGLDRYPVIVIGGLIPGQSTASVAVEVAEALGSQIVVDYSVIGMVYDRDPAKYPDAKPIKEISAKELIELLEQSSEPGHYEFFDKKALTLAVRSRIKIYVTSYKEPGSIWTILSNGNPGTIIYPE